MFVIDPQKLIYAGAIDDHATTDTSDIKESKIILAALTGRWLDSRWLRRLSHAVVLVKYQ